MRKLVHLLRRGFYTNDQEKFHQVCAAFSQRPPQDLRVMLRMLAELVSPRTSVYVTQFNHPKAMPLDDWWQRDEGSSVKTIHEWTELLATFSANSEEQVLVTGSYYFVAEVMSRLAELGATPRQCR
jgi:folylpolyglutamate synthase/dihydropteroate synthase